jgi:hypothetical protein
MIWNDLAFRLVLVLVSFFLGIEMIPRMPRKVRDMVNELRVGQVLVLMDERVLRCQIRQRHTEHVGFTPSLADVPVKQLSLLELLGGG